MRQTALLSAVLTLIGCDKSKAPPTAAPPTTAAAPADEAPEPSVPADACRDWSDLDVASLPPLPHTPYTATLEHAWQTVLTKHYDPTLGCKDWPALRTEYGEKLKAAKTRPEAYALMNAMLAELEQSHLGIVPPAAGGGEPRMGTSEGSAAVPVTVRYLGGEAIIVDAARGGARSGLPGGASILEVDGRPISTAVKQAQARSHRDAEVAFHVSRAVTGWLTCPRGGKKTVAFKPVGAAAAKKKTVACREAKVERLTMGNLKDVPVSVKHKMLRGKVGYITFNIWLLQLMPKIEAALGKLRAKGMRALIIDLRGNPGGVGMMVVPLARQLLQESASLGEMRLREGSQVFKVTAEEDAFAGEVVILVDERSASTSEIFAQAMQDLGRAKIFGAGPTVGAALPSLIEELPGGAMLQYVVADYQSPNGVSVEARGVAPDVQVPETAADFANGGDPVLDAATKALQTPAKG